MDDWELLVADLPWMAPPHHRGAVVGPTVAWDRPVPAWAVDLGALLRAAAVTPVLVDDERFEVLGWSRPDGLRAGWLCPSPATDLSGVDLHPEHAALVSSWGGIVERFHEPLSWLLNANDSLTLAVSATDAGLLDDYEWMWTDHGQTCPISPDQRHAWYVVSEEANGNVTLVHRVTGEVLLFAPDHAFDHVTPVPGCPEFSLYRLDGASHLSDWVEVVAAQWLQAITLP